MANAADYLTFSTQQVVANYKLRDRAISSQEVTVTNISTVFRITVLVEDTFDGSILTPNQLTLEPRESKTFTISYDLNVMESLPAGIIPATINFIATAEPIIIPPLPPLAPPPPPPPPLPVVYRGCTDTTAFNYNNLATVDDGSCIAKIYGCTNSNAINYNPSANINTECEFPPVQEVIPIVGCTNRTALNYNSQATQDDGSCIQSIPGCQDSTALNYNPNANTSADCTYALPIEGCTDRNAVNYNPIATISKNDTCSYITTETNDIFGCLDSNSKNYNPNATKPALPDICEPHDVYGCQNSNACNYNPNATIDDGRCTFPDRFGNCGPVLGCTDGNAANYNPQATENDGTCRYINGQVLGCTNLNAINYFRLATVDDGTCLFNKSGCTNITATNYDPEATQDNGSCKFIGCKNSSATNYNASSDIVACPNDVCCNFGCTNETVCTTIGQIYSVGPADSSGFAAVCRYIQNYLTNTPDYGNLVVGECKTGCTTSCVSEFVGKTDVYGCTDPRMSNYNPDATKDDGSCVTIKGCTSSTAVNYNPRAMENDGSCVESITGCMDPQAKNYNPQATINNVTCIYDTLGCTDFVALNYNPSATINDGSCSYYTSGGGGGDTGRGTTELDIVNMNVGGNTVESGGVVTSNQI